MSAAEHPALAELIDDVDEAVTALAVSGVAFPDPELPDDLDGLAGRLVAAGLGGGARRLEALARPLRGLSEATDPEHRRDLGVQAIEAGQDLTGWLRVLRAALALEAVKARLQREASDAPASRRRGEDLDVVPVGVEQAGSRWMVHGLTGDGRWVVLADELGEVDEADPLRCRAVSRLFQDRVTPVDVLAGRVELRDHPLTRSGGRVVARPVFHTRPRLVPRGEAPVLPRSGPGPHEVRLTVRWGAPGFRISGPGGPVSLATDGPLDRALRRRLAWEGEPLDLDVVAISRGEGLAVLGWLDDLGGPGWPTVDPGAARWPAVPLAERLGDDVEGRVGRGALHAAGVGPAEELPAGDDLQGAFRAAVVRSLLGQAVEAVEAAEVFVGRGAAGEDTFGLLWPAVWLVLEGGRGEAMADALRALRDARRATPLRSEDEWDEICLRGRLIAELERDDEGRPPPAAAAFVEAHLASLRRQVGEGRVPEPLALWALADTRARARGERPAPGVVRDLGLELDVLRDAIDRPLCAWLRSGEPPEWSEVDALVLLAAADLGVQLVR